MEAHRNAVPDPSRAVRSRAAGPLPQRRFAGSLLDPRAEDLRVAGRVVGQLVTLGDRVQLFTTQPSLAELDGQVFVDRDALVAAVRGALCGPLSESAAGPAAHSPGVSEIRAMPGVSVTMRRALRSSK